MTSDIALILSEFVQEIKAQLGNDVQSIILYGPYARGDFNAQSDVGCDDFGKQL